jgi:hypothetical protein
MRIRLDAELVISRCGSGAWERWKLFARFVIEVMNLRSRSRLAVA